MTTATMPPPVKLLTAEEFGERYGSKYVELIDGRVVEVSIPDFNHGAINVLISYFIAEYLFKTKIGRAASNDSFVKTKSNPDRVRGADVAFLSYRRWPKGQSLKGILPVVPELIFEVRSPSDRDRAATEKTNEYLRAGVDCVVVIDPETQTATVHRNGRAESFIAADETISVPDLLPGFALPLAKLFE